MKRESPKQDQDAVHNENCPELKAYNERESGDSDCGYPGISEKTANCDPKKNKTFFSRVTLYLIHVLRC